MESGVSIIIPTLNERTNIQKLVSSLRSNSNSPHFEIIIVDGGSTDSTLESIKDYEVITIQAKKASRPHQMNLGAQHATYPLLYFVHADVSLPETFFSDVTEAAKQHEIGCYQYRFDSTNPLLKINGFFSRFPMMWCRGGDQTLFITRSLFDQLNGYDEDYCVMEDFDLIKRAKSLTNFHIIPKRITVSARKYTHNSYFKVQRTNLKAFRMYKRGVDPKKIRSFYKTALSLVDY